MAEPGWTTLVWLTSCLAALACRSNPSPTLQSAVPAPSLEESPTTQVETAPKAIPARELVVATWNVEWLNRNDQRGPVKRNPRDYVRLARHASRLAADVIALQEVDGADAAARIFDPKMYDFHFASGGGAQRAGFAWRRDLDVSVNPDLTALDVGGVRAGADLSVRTAQGTLRLLSVHLKSGCFDGPLSDSDNACRKLWRQLPELEGWIDARALEVESAGEIEASKPSRREHTLWFGVLGDFNRRFFAKPDEPFWREIDDGQPPEADLDSPTRGPQRRCWNAHDQRGVDHLVLGRSLFARVVPGSFRELLFDERDAAFKPVLSDHCPLSVRLRL